MQFTDQMNRQCVLETPPKRIVSLVPSQSELLWDLGLKNNIVGITRFCIHPDEMFQSIKRVGGTKKLSVETIEQLQPDLIIGNKEENTREQIEILAGKFPVWMSDINSITDALQMITAIGEITSTTGESLKLLNKIDQQLSLIKNIFQDKKIIYLIWQQPFYAVGRQTFINDFLQHLGFQNLITTSRYPEIAVEDLYHFAPDYLFLSTEPFPFSDTHLREIQSYLPHTKVSLINGEFCSWYGSRLMKTGNYFQELKSALEHK